MSRSAGIHGLLWHTGYLYALPDGITFNAVGESWVGERICDERGFVCSLSTVLLGLESFQSLVAVAVGMGRQTR
jgi:hypothetical protein